MTNLRCIFRSPDIADQRAKSVIPTIRLTQLLKKGKGLFKEQVLMTHGHGQQSADYLWEVGRGRIRGEHQGKIGAAVIEEQLKKAQNHLGSSSWEFQHGLEDTSS